MTLIILCKSVQKYFYHQFVTGKMSVIIILLFASISVAAIFLAAFLWGVKTGSLKMIIRPLPAFCLMTNPPQQPNHYNTYK